MGRPRQGRRGRAGPQRRGEAGVGRVEDGGQGALEGDGGGRAGQVRREGGVADLARGVLAEDVVCHCVAEDAGF